MRNRIIGWKCEVVSMLLGIVLLGGNLEGQTLRVIVPEEGSHRVITHFLCKVDSLRPFRYYHRRDTVWIQILGRTQVRPAPGRWWVQVLNEYHSQARWAVRYRWKTEHQIQTCQEFMPQVNTPRFRSGLIQVLRAPLSEALGNRARYLRIDLDLDTQGDTLQAFFSLYIYAADLPPTGYIISRNTLRRSFRRIQKTIQDSFLRYLRENFQDCQVRILRYSGVSGDTCTVLLRIRIFPSALRRLVREERPRSESSLLNRWFRFPSPNHPWILVYRLTGRKTIQNFLAQNRDTSLVFLWRGDNLWIAHFSGEVVADQEARKIQQTLSRLIKEAEYTTPDTG